MYKTPVELLTPPELIDRHRWQVLDHAAFVREGKVPEKVARRLQETETELLKRLEAK